MPKGRRADACGFEARDPVAVGPAMGYGVGHLIDQTTRKSTLVPGNATHERAVSVTFGTT
jgi:hypothetical protein